MRQNKEENSAERSKADTGGEKANESKNDNNTLQNAKRTGKTAAKENEQLTGENESKEEKENADALVADYRANVDEMTHRLRPGENFDVNRRTVTVAENEVSFFYINGFTKEGETQRILQFLFSLDTLGGAGELARVIPYGEVAICGDYAQAVRAVLSGQCVMFAEPFGDEALLLDLRMYPARQTAEPESDRVTQGARDGFVETLLTNTALMRRRVRDERLTMRHFNLGGSSQTDVVMCYLDGVARADYVEEIARRLEKIRPRSLTLGFRSLAESLIRTRWYNPFPKLRTTERPDTAAAHVLEGSILIFCDTSPEAMILPCSLFDFLQQTMDYYFPPLTGTYLRVVRMFILILSVISTPLWYLALMHAADLPPGLSFLIPENPGVIPILIQLYLAELAIDGLKIASMNTPDILSNSLSIVGALILSDFVVSVGWLCEDVILNMAFVAIANFAQQNRELGYAFKFLRVLTLTLTAAAGLWGFLAGMLIGCLLAATNNTLCDGHSYLYPLVPFDKNALKHLLFRTKKDDFADSRRKNVS